MGIFPKFRGENKKSLKPPPSLVVVTFVKSQYQLKGAVRCAKVHLLQIQFAPGICLKMSFGCRSLVARRLFWRRHFWAKSIGWVNLELYIGEFWRPSEMILLLIRRLSHYLQGFSTIPGGCLGLLPSTVS